MVKELKIYVFCEPEYFLLSTKDSEGMDNEEEHIARSFGLISDGSISVIPKVGKNAPL